jgi:hypothetical protein
VEELLTEADSAKAFANHSVVVSDMGEELAIHSGEMDTTIENSRPGSNAVKVVSAWH